MNILIITTKLPYPPNDGGAIATINVAKGLAENGHKIVMLAMNTTKHFFPPDRIPQDLSHSIEFITIPVNTRINWMKLVINLVFSRFPYNAVRFFSPLFLRHLQNLLSERSFDVIQMEGPYLKFYLPAIRKYSDAVISFRAHNLEYLIWRRRAENTGNPLKRFYLRSLSRRILNLEKKLLGEVDVVVPISEKDLTGLQDLCDTKPFFTCAAGINLQDYPEPESIHSFSVFFIGALDWGPNTEGLDWFLKTVWPEITAKIPGITFHIAGRNSHYYKKQHLPENIILEGEVENARKFINAHSVMLVPLLSGSGIRIKIIEGMAMGRTVITTSTGAEGLPVTDGKNIIIANEPTEFVDQLLKLHYDNNRITAIGKEARNLIKEKFDNLAITNKLADFYKEMLK